MSDILDDPYSYKPYSSTANSMAPFQTLPSNQMPGIKNPNELPSVDTAAGNAGVYRGSNRQAYDRPRMLQRINEGVDTQSNLMGPAQDQSPEDQALSARANQFYNTSLTKLARDAIPKSIAMTGKLQAQDITNRSAIYADMQTRAMINYKEAIMEREKAIGVAVMQRDLYGSLFGGLAKIGGSVAASILSTPSGSNSYYGSQLSMPQMDSGYSTTSGAPGLGVGSAVPDDFVGPVQPSGGGYNLGMNYDFGGG